MGAKTLPSLEEFMALPRDGSRHELSQGELVVSPAPGWIYTYVVHRINEILSEHVEKQRTGWVFIGAGYMLSHAPEMTVRQAAVSFLSKERLRAMPEGIYLEGAPDLAIEVISPSNSAEDLEIKIKQYLAAGSREAWIFYPKTRTVHIHKAGGQACVLGESDTITTDLFPGWSARVADFFNLDD